MATATGTATSWRPTSIAMALRLWSEVMDRLKLQTVTISALSGSYAIRPAATTDVYTFYLYDYNPTGGAKT